MKQLECRKCDTKFKFVNTKRVTCPECGREFDNYFFEPGKTENQALIIGAVVLIVVLGIGGYFLFGRGGNEIPPGGDGTRLADKTIGQNPIQHASVFGSRRPVTTSMQGSTLTLEFPMDKQFSNTMTRSITERNCVTLLKQVQGMPGIREVKIIGNVVMGSGPPEKGFAIKYLMEDVNKFNFEVATTNDILWEGESIWWHEDFGYQTDSP